MINRISSADIAFFALINEKNFFTNRKGEHSQDNLEEFCTSFLHTLLYPEKIMPNVEQLHSTDRGRTVHSSSAEEKKRILTYYQRIIASFIESVGKSGSEPFGAFLEAKLTYVKKLINDSSSAKR